MAESTAARDRTIEADPVTEATIADLCIAADMTGPHELMNIPKVRVVELLDEIKRLRALAGVPDRDVERDAADKRWNEAVDWLLNSRHTAEPGIQGPFWDYVDGKITLDELRKS